MYMEQAFAFTSDPSSRRGKWKIGMQIYSNLTPIMSTTTRKETLNFLDSHRFSCFNIPNTFINYFNQNLNK